jgi:hypothetical protein
MAGDAEDDQDDDRQNPDKSRKRQKHDATDQDTIH